MNVEPMLADHGQISKARLTTKAFHKLKLPLVQLLENVDDGNPCCERRRGREKKDQETNGML
jgi:hypothetical protein